MLGSKMKTMTINEADNYRRGMPSIIANEKYFIKRAAIQCKSDSKHESSFVVATATLGVQKMGNYKKTLAVKKKSASENCCFSVARRRCRSASPSPTPLTDASTRLQSARLQTLRVENLSRCKKLLMCNGYPSRVLLYPEESWARSAASSYWTLSPTWWNCNRCKVVEVTGTKKFTTQAKMVETDCGNLYIIGSFKKCTDPDFKLILTTNITIADFNMGYCMTGSLECGSHKHNSYQTTHFAAVRRAEFNVGLFS